eukprot:CAMPEP_0194493068 /NCGR_PEP_ID=MMETSP0253-20130528/11397_1 /TAXON_ID=2966 /ORGANISM="Noctiluca scintillans" /LENGTH=80 /DNA_ID=CAMNT_0039334005 /DNA_START=76 /DNA_END=315 /DNA_ORIENTATION=-
MGTLIVLKPNTSDDRTNFFRAKRARLKNFVTVLHNLVSSCPGFRLRAKLAINFSTRDSPGKSVSDGSAKPSFSKSFRNCS